MDVQAFFNAISAAAASERSKYHLTLGELIDALKSVPPETPVRVTTGGSLSSPHSYRGYYSDLSFEPAADGVLAGHLLEDCVKANGQTFEGYKGGDFEMTEATPLWLSSEGIASGIALMTASLVDGALQITTLQAD